tara:strand:+ start:23721 stop:25874 length:2154 start_codon:yes stop_codon:yes gene_type:complete
MVFNLRRIWLTFLVFSVPASSAQIAPIKLIHDLTKDSNNSKPTGIFSNITEYFSNQTNTSAIRNSTINFVKKTSSLVTLTIIQLCAMSPASCNQIINDFFGKVTNVPVKSEKHSFFEIYADGSPDGTTWDDVIGNKDSVNDIRRLLSLSLSRDTIEKARRAGVSVPRNILLIGPPGTGKTLMARAAANEMKIPLFVVSASEIVKGKYAGIGVERVKTLFTTARKRALKNKNRMSMIFIDELDSCGRSRGGSDSSVSIDHDNTLNQLLVELDGFKSRDESEPLIIVFGATNRKDILDSALLRKGRFDNIVHLRRPDLNDRTSLYKYYVNKQRMNGRSREISIKNGKRSDIIFQALNEKAIDNDKNITTLKVVTPLRFAGNKIQATLFSNRTARVKAKEISRLLRKAKKVTNETSEFIYDIHYGGSLENDDVNFIERLAQLSDGLVGADINAIVNEAALKAMDEGRIFAIEEDYLNVIENTILGKPILNLDYKPDWRIAIHEAGHILASFVLENIDFATRASIIPRSGGSLGVTMFSIGDIKNLRASELRDRLVMILSGKAAESYIFDGDSSTGASDDVNRALMLAKSIVKNFAMDGVKYTLDGEDSNMEVKKELINAENRAYNLVRKYNDTLYTIANELMVHETLDEDSLNTLVANLDSKEQKNINSPKEIIMNIMSDFRKIRDKNVNTDIVKTRADRRKQAAVFLLILILPSFYKND